MEKLLDAVLTEDKFQCLSSLIKPDQLQQLGSRVEEFKQNAVNNPKLVNICKEGYTNVQDRMLAHLTIDLEKMINNLKLPN